MRTAEEWYRKINSYSNPSFMNDVPREWVIKMINEARREALVEAAKRAKITTQHKVSTHHVPYPVVDKQSILDLINELK